MVRCGCLSGSWFKSLINLRRTSKKGKVHSTNTEKSNASKEDDVALANGNSRRIRIPGMPTEYVAAIRIQTAFRAYIARKTLHRLKGAVRFNILIQSHDTQKQAFSTLQCIHNWSYIQDQIRARRYHMVTEGRIKQKRLENQLKVEAKLHDLEVEWNGGSETMEEILSRIQQREEAAVKRERAMAYAFSHQWRANPTQYLGQAYYSIGKENWGWSWKERWIAARPWEVRIPSPTSNNRKQGHSIQVSMSDVKTSVSSTPVVVNGKGKIKSNP